MEHIWGFDIGTTSIGFAVVNLDDETHEGSIVREGVRIFPESRQEKTLEPRNQARRAARLLRRQVRRRRLRRRFLREAFAEAGLLPRYGSPEWDQFVAPRRRDGAPPQTDPYLLRARGLREPLQPFEIGRALYHLCHRRGFLSARRIDERKEQAKTREKEEGEIKAEISGLKKKLQDLMLGEFVYLASLEKDGRDRLAKDWSLPPNEYLQTLDKPERIRGRHISREMVMDEFDRLWKKQADSHAILLTNEAKQRIETILLYQRPIFWRLQTVGECSLERGEPPCAKGSWLGQQFLMLQHVNNLRFTFPGELSRALRRKQREDGPDDEREILLAKLQCQEQMTFAGVKKTLKILWKARGLSLNPEIPLEKGGEKRLLGNWVEARLVAVFGDAWGNHAMRDRLRAELYPRLFRIYNRQVGNKRIELLRHDKFTDEIAPASAKFAEEVQSDFGITREQAEALAASEPPSGWLRYSEKAIRRLLPYLEAGFVLNEAGGALDQAYPNWKKLGEGAALDRLPSNPKAMPAPRNPSVNRALNELRKVANNLLSAYGKPDVIRIELLRELKKSKLERTKIRQRYKQNRDNRDEAKRDLADKNIQATPEAVDAWLLWKESDEYCPYTGRKICFADLFQRGEFQVEHIFPLSRSLDNNMLNKTLCATDVNRAKGNLTPFEYFRSRPEEWEEVKIRLRKWVQKGIFLEEKMKAFIREDYPQGQEFLEERQRADSSYIAVEARKFLARLGVPVEVANGPVTAQLRTHWGLDAILNHGDARKPKNRADHRHHAVDALAVALTSRAFVKRLSDFYARDKRGENPKLPQPWENFWQDANEMTTGSDGAGRPRIVVSHRVQRKVSGALHAQTYYGDTGEEETSSGITYRKFVFRKPVKDASPEDIRDPEVKRIVREHAQKYGAKADGKPSIKEAVARAGYPVLPDKNTGEAREIRKVRIWKTQQQDLMVPVWPKQKMGLEPKTFADPADNHHMAIFRSENGEIEFETVSLYEAARRIKAREPVIRSKMENGARFVMSLAPGDVLEFPGENGAKDYRVATSVWAAGPIVLEDHTEAKSKVWSRPNPASLLKMGARKVKVDPIGRVRAAGD